MTAFRFENGQPLFDQDMRLRALVFFPPLSWEARARGYFHVLVDDPPRYEPFPPYHKELPMPVAQAHYIMTISVVEKMVAYGGLAERRAFYFMVAHDLDKHPEFFRHPLVVPIETWN